MPAYKVVCKFEILLLKLRFLSVSSTPRVFRVGLLVRSHSSHSWNRICDYEICWKSLPPYKREFERRPAIVTLVRADIRRIFTSKMRMFAMLAPPHVWNPDVRYLSCMLASKHLCESHILKQVMRRYTISIQTTEIHGDYISSRAYVALVFYRITPRV